jgi:hypothetical protein
VNLSLATCISQASRLDSRHMRFTRSGRGSPTRALRRAGWAPGIASANIASANIARIAAPLATGFIVDHTGQFFWAFITAGAAELAEVAGWVWVIPRVETPDWTLRASRIRSR